MDPNANDDVVFEFPYLFRIYKDGHIERLLHPETAPTGTDPRTGVQSKDITINPTTGVAARLYLPPNAANNHPFLIYIHGGAFCICSPFDLGYHHHLNTISAEASAVIVSVHYRVAPEAPLPIAYEDTWEVIQWATSLPDPWLKNHADPGLVFFAGDSAGGNIAHSLAMRGDLGGGLKLQGIVLIHPFFGNDEKDKLVEAVFPEYGGIDDPLIHAPRDPKISGLGCGKVLVFVAGNDVLADRGRSYYEALKKSGWSGAVQLVETPGEGHVFHLFEPTQENAVALVKIFASFIKQVETDVTLG